MLAKTQVVYLLFLVVLVVCCGVENGIGRVTSPSTERDNQRPSQYIATSTDERLVSVENKYNLSYGGCPSCFSVIDTKEGVNSISYEKGNIVLSSGTYDLTSSLQVTDNTSIFAEDGTKLRFLGNSYLNLTGDNITVCGLEIEGDSLNNEFGIRASGNCISIENCSVRNIGQAGSFGFGIIYEYGSKNGLVNNNIVENTGLDGIHLRGNENTTVSSNTVIDSNDDGISSIFGEENLIVNNAVNRQGSINKAGNGIYLADKNTTVRGNYITKIPLNGITAEVFHDHQTSGLIITNNTIESAGLAESELHFGGILLNYVSETKVTANCIADSLYGIRIFNGSRNLVSENNISGNVETADVWGSGILLEYQSTNNTIINNNVTDSTYAVAETGFGVDFNTISFPEEPSAEVHLEGTSSYTAYSQPR